jgi:hypothetical protein
MGIAVLVWIFMIIISPRQYQSKIHQLGLSLVEILLVVASILGAGLLVLQASQRSSLAGHVQIEQQHLKSLSDSINGAYGKIGSLSTLSSSGFIGAGLAPAEMQSAGTLTHAWGGTVDLAPTATGYTITYSNMPQDACNSFTSAAANIAATVSVNKKDVFSNGTLNPQKLVDECSGGNSGKGRVANDVVFTFTSSTTQQSAAALAAISPPPPPPPPPPCPTCPGVTPPPGVAPPVVLLPGTPGIITPVVIAPISGSPPCATATAQTQTVACASGQVGNHVQIQTRTCGGAWGPWTDYYNGCRPVGVNLLVKPPAPSGCPLCGDGTYVQNSNFNPSYPQTWSCGATPPAWASGCAAKTPPPPPLYLACHLGTYGVTGSGYSPTYAIVPDGGSCSTSQKPFTMPDGSTGQWLDLSIGDSLQLVKGSFGYPDTTQPYYAGLTDATILAGSFVKWEIWASDQHGRNVQCFAVDAAVGVINGPMVTRCILTPFKPMSLMMPVGDLEDDITITAKYLPDGVTPSGAVQIIKLKAFSPNNHW